MTISDHLHRLLPHVLPPQADGSFVYPLYAAPDDRLTESQLAAIATASGSQTEAFYEQLEDTYDIWVDYAIDAIMADLRPLWDSTVASSEDALSWHTVQYTVRDFLQEQVTFLMDYGHFLRQPVSVNLIVNTGDGNADFTCNNLIPPDGAPIRISPQSSLLWLVRQQGYTVRDLRRAIQQGGSPTKPLLDSLYQECANAPSLMNALTFFVTLPLHAYLDWVDSRRPLTVSAETRCGLWNPWHGGGGLLAIHLERPVVIPRQYAEPAFDGVRGRYSVAETYGVTRAFWTDTVLPSAHTA